MSDTTTTAVSTGVPVLQLNEVHTFYGAIEALKGISIEVNQGEIVTLIGANGAGKSTTLKTISGLLTPRVGEILFMGERISGLKVHQVAAKQIVQVPEGRRIFPRMTVEENLEMGAFLRSLPWLEQRMTEWLIDPEHPGRHTTFSKATGIYPNVDPDLDPNDFDAHTESVKESMERVFDLFPRLKERRTQKGGTLSGGEQQMLAMGRGLMGSPKLLMLDEPSMGLAPVIVEIIFEIIQQLNKDGITILLVEQNAAMALSIADRGYVLETGSVALKGPGKELLHNEQVRKTYRGET